jgi:hypothetical protein
VTGLTQPDDWRPGLAAARLPATPEQDRWDASWRERFGRFRAGGKTPRDAIRIANKLTEDQHGRRPGDTTEDT